MSSSATGEKYSVIVPTYNERENVALCVFLLHKHLSARCAGAAHCIDHAAASERVRTLSTAWGTGCVLSLPHAQSAIQATSLN